MLSMVFPPSSLEIFTQIRDSLELLQRPLFRFMNCKINFFSSVKRQPFLAQNLKNWFCRSTMDSTCVLKMLRFCQAGKKCLFMQA